MITASIAIRPDGRFFLIGPDGETRPLPEDQFVADVYALVRQKERANYEAADYSPVEFSLRSARHEIGPCARGGGYVCRIGRSRERTRSWSEAWLRCWPDMLDDAVLMRPRRNKGVDEVRRLPLPVADPTPEQRDGYLKQNRLLQEELRRELRKRQRALRKMEASESDQVLEGVRVGVAQLKEEIAQLEADCNAVYVPKGSFKGSVEKLTSKSLAKKKAKAKKRKPKKKSKKWIDVAAAFHDVRTPFPDPFFRQAFIESLSVFPFSGETVDDLSELEQGQVKPVLEEWRIWGEGLPSREGPRPAAFPLLSRAQQPPRTPQELAWHHEYLERWKRSVRKRRKLAKERKTAAWGSGIDPEEVRIKMPRRPSAKAKELAGASSSLYAYRTQKIPRSGSGRGWSTDLELAFGQAMLRKPANTRGRDIDVLEARLAKEAPSGKDWRQGRSLYSRSPARDHAIRWFYIWRPSASDDPKWVDDFVVLAEYVTATAPPGMKSPRTSGQFAETTRHIVARLDQALRMDNDPSRALEKLREFDQAVKDKKKKKKATKKKATKKKAAKKKATKKKATKKNMGHDVSAAELAVEGLVNMVEEYGWQCGDLDTREAQARLARMAKTLCYELSGVGQTRQALNPSLSPPIQKLLNEARRAGIVAQEASDGHGGRYLRFYGPQGRLLAVVSGQGSAEEAMYVASALKPSELRPSGYDADVVTALKQRLIA